MPETKERKANTPQGGELSQNNALETVLSSFNDSRKASTLDYDRFATYYKLFRNIQTKKNYSGLANLFIPEPYRIIRKKTAKLSNAFKRITVRPESPNDVESSRTASHLLNFLRRKLNWELTERTAIQESRITGLAWLKAVWLVSRETEKQPYLGFNVSYETADHIFVNPEATLLDVFENKLRYLVHEYETDIKDLEDNPNYDKNLVAALKLEQASSHKEQTQLDQARLMQLSMNKVNLTKKIHVLEFWGKFNGKDYIIVAANKRLILRQEENPYKDVLDNPIPFTPVPANIVGQEFFPVGDLEPAESLFNELNDTRNQRMDTVTLNIDPAKEIVRGAGIDEKELIARKGWLIHSNIPGGVRFIPPDMQGVNASINEEKNIRGDIQQVTGVLDFSPGAEVQAGVSIDTARGTMIAKGEADIQSEDELKILKISFRMFYRIILSFAQNFLDRQFIIRVTENGSEQFLAVDKNAIQGNYDLDIEMETLQDQTTRQQLQLMLFNQAKDVPGAKVGKFFTDVLESFKDDINIKEYYEEPQPQGPPPPSISISLRGELSSSETDEIYKMTGADPKAADPILRQDLREMMRGNLPEHADRQNQELDMAQKQQALQQVEPAPQ